jgi:hypothetical protein
MFRWFPTTVGAAAILALVACAGQDEAEPTPDQPRLSSQEAIGLVATEYQLCGAQRAGTTGALIAQDAKASYLGNEKWQVMLTIDTDSVWRWTVDERQNAVIPIGIPLPCVSPR